MHISRRKFLRTAVTVVSGASLANRPGVRLVAATSDPLFKISLGEWSLHRSLFGGRLKHLDVARVIKRDYGIDALEYSAQFFKDKANDNKYLRKLKQRARDENVRSVLITVDNEGNLGDPDKKLQLQAVENHYKWVRAAKSLDCESIRVNAYSDRGLSDEEQAKLVVDGLTRLVDFGAQHGLNVIVENHGWLSSNGQWLAGVVKKVGRPNCGTLPDFGNFHLGDGAEYDRYQGVAELMPYAKAVSAKCYDFDAEGDETTIDFRRMMKIVVDSGFCGYVGIEYEGHRLSERDGILTARKLLETVRRELTFG